MDVKQLSKFGETCANPKLSLAKEEGFQCCESCIPEFPLIFVVVIKKKDEFILAPGDFKK